jgi:outer membrane autotransporter protein
VAAAPALPPAGPGIWAKAVGSWTDRSATASTTILGTTFGVDTSYNQDVYGVLGGADFGREAVLSPGDVAVFGIMGGYVTSDLDFKAFPAKFRYEGGTVGFSSTYIRGGFFIDSLTKADFLDIDLSFPGADSVSTSALTFGSMTNVGYRFDGALGFIEPLATFAYARTSFDQFGFGGVTVAIPDAESIRGGLGLRVGTAFLDTASYRVEGSVLGRVWHEFSADNVATLVTPGLPFTSADSFNGTFGEVKGGVDLFSKGSGLSGFVNTGVKFNEDATTITAKGGIRFQW